MVWLLRTATLVALQASTLFAGQAVGWRTDGSGSYPNVTPPTEWAPNKNIVWTSPMPALSNGSIILVGDKIFACAEPDLLLCVQASDGKMLWQKSSSYTDMLTPAEAEKEKENQQKAEPLLKELQTLQQSLRRLNQQIRRAPEDKALKENATELNKKIGDLNTQLAPLTLKNQLPATHPTNGYSSSTPTCDGESVYVVFGTGVAACYSLEGQRRWIKLLEKPPHEWGFSSSPLLADGKLLVHIKDLVALNPKDGELVWRAPVPWAWGSPVSTSIGNVPVALLPCGACVRVSDGKVLAQKLATLTYNAPVIQNQIVYYINETGGAAVKLPAAIAEPLKTENLWTNKPNPDRYYASPIVHEGLIFDIQQKGIFSVFDALTGQLIYEKQLALGGKPYPSVTLAGKFLYVSSDNGHTLVLQPGKEYKEVASNSLSDTLRGTPVFSGTRMYWRGYKNLYCIGQ